jgi:hypothetical protein
MSETGSLDRMKSAVERRKKVGLDTDTAPTVSCRVEGTRVNPETLIDEILKNKKLDQLEESAESKENLSTPTGHSNLTFVYAQFQHLAYSCSSPAMAPLRSAVKRPKHVCHRVHSGRW